MHFDPSLLARAEDYWREELIQNTRNNIKTYNKERAAKATSRFLKNRSILTQETSEQIDNSIEDWWCKGYSQYDQIKHASDLKTIPDFFFDTHEDDKDGSPVDPGHWFFSVKEDGYLVILSRDWKTQNWSLQTRKGVAYYPPLDFLSGLKKSTQLPDVMVGELITDEKCWDENGFGDIENRAVKRNQQFSKLAKIWWNKAHPEDTKQAERDLDKNTKAWTGLRIKIFSFPSPQNTHNIRETYCQNFQKMCAAIHNHPWIGMCNMLKVRKDHPELIIDIFRRVVQMGLEGIVLVEPDVKYADLNHPEDKKFFKLKPKTVLPLRYYKPVHPFFQVKPDGTTKEYTYETEVKGKKIRFHDLIEIQRRNYSRIKYMEFARDVHNFQCHQGIRHTHFAQDDDMSMEVSAWTRGQDAAHDAADDADKLVKKILLVGDTSRGCITRARVLNPKGWNKCIDTDFAPAMNSKRRQQQEQDKVANDKVAKDEVVKDEVVKDEVEDACSPPCGGGGSSPCKRRAGMRRAGAGVMVGDRWIARNRDQLHGAAGAAGAAHAQEMRLNPYIVDVV